MKRLFCVLLAAALLLTGCGSRETAAEQEPLSVYMEAAPVMGRSYAPQSPLPREVTPMAEGGQLEKGSIWRAAQSDDGQAALYSLDSDAGTVLVEWDGDLAAFDGWSFQSPQCVQPLLEVLDIGGTEALVIRLFIGGGTVVSAEALHILVKDSRGYMTDYTLPESLYTERLAELMTAEIGKRNGSVSIGNLTLNLPGQGRKFTGGPCLGSIVCYKISGGAIFLTLAIGMETEGTAVPTYVGELLADVTFDRDTGTYTLSGFALRED